jgi:hypothetical protein
VCEIDHTYASSSEDGNEWEHTSASNIRIHLYGVYSNKLLFLNFCLIRTASWLGGQTFWLLTMRSRVRFPVLAWEFSLAGEDPRGDHGPSSL